MTSFEELKGRCYCAALEFTARTPSGEAKVIHCHCNGCREWTGGIAYSAVPVTELNFTKGTPKVFKRLRGPEKVFCSECGTGICNNIVFGPFRHTVAAGLFPDVLLESKLHCQMASKVAWADLSADGKPSYDAWPPS